MKRDLWIKIWCIKKLLAHSFRAVFTILFRTHCLEFATENIKINIYRPIICMLLPVILKLNCYERKIVDFWVFWVTNADEVIRTKEEKVTGYNYHNLRYCLSPLLYLKQLLGYWFLFPSSGRTYSVEPNR